MASNQLSNCCITGSLHEGDAKGSLQDIQNSLCSPPALRYPQDSINVESQGRRKIQTNLGNIYGIVSTYVAYPPDKSTKNAILIITDVIGYKFINAQLIADQFAAKGYFVIMPDMFNGDSVPLNRPEGFNIMDWVRNHSPLQTEPIINTVLEEMRGNLGCQRIGGVGYCFGGKYVCRYLRAGLLDVGYIAHPTMLEGDELRGVEGPLSIAAAVRDFVFVTAKRHESEEILDKLEVVHQIYLFSEVEHGFAVRCDLTKSRQRFAKEQAFYQAVAWFDHYLKE